MITSEGTRLRLLIGAWLTALWVLLWGQVSAGNLLTGALVAACIVAVFPPQETNDDPFVVRPVATAWFLVWFLRELVITNVAVAREVLLPARRSEIRPAIVAVQLQTRSGRLATIIANAITLTPGTLTLEARNRPATIYVHVLAFVDAESTRREVAALERRVVRAFGTAEEVRRICGPSGSGPT